MNKDLCVIFCPPFPEYITPPSDHSQSTLIECPECTIKMWLSLKKKLMMDLAESHKQEVYLACYECFAKTVGEWAKDGNLNNIERIDL